MLDSTGHTVQQNALGSLSAREGFTSSASGKGHNSEDLVEAKRPVKKKTQLPKSLSGPSANDVMDLHRRIGDASIYKYYFASIGWKIMLGLIATVILNTLSASFPRKSTHFSTKRSALQITHFGTRNMAEVVYEWDRQWCRSFRWQLCRFRCDGIAHDRRLYGVSSAYSLYNCSSC